MGVWLFTVASSSSRVFSAMEGSAMKTCLQTKWLLSFNMFIKIYWVFPRPPFGIVAYAFMLFWTTFVETAVYYVLWLSINPSILKLDQLELSNSLLFLNIMYHRLVKPETRLPPESGKLRTKLIDFRRSLCCAAASTNLNTIRNKTSRWWAVRSLMAASDLLTLFLTVSAVHGQTYSPYLQRTGMSVWNLSFH